MVIGNGSVTYFVYCSEVLDALPVIISRPWGRDVYLTVIDLSVEEVSIYIKIFNGFVDCCCNVTVFYFTLNKRKGRFSNW